MQYLQLPNREDSVVGRMDIGFHSLNYDPIQILNYEKTPKTL